jgi:HPt (histidine-containing phosphotransfer) domain-containing protein
MSANAAVAQKPKVHIWRIRNKLKDRALLGGAATGAAFDATALETAQEQFEQMSEEYVDWVGDSFGELSRLIGELGELAGDKRLAGWERIHRISHELKGEGGTFNYPLISVIAKSLQECTRPKTPMGDNNVKILKAHADAMQAVIKDRIHGDGGKIGQDLLEGLKEAIAKHSS